MRGVLQWWGAAGNRLRTKLEAFGSGAVAVERVQMLPGGTSRRQSLERSEPRKGEFRTTPFARQLGLWCLLPAGYVTVPSFVLMKFEIGLSALSVSQNKVFVRR